MRRVSFSENVVLKLALEGFFGCSSPGSSRDNRPQFDSLGAFFYAHALAAGCPTISSRGRRAVFPNQCATIAPDVVQKLELSGIEVADGTQIVATGL